MIMNPSLKVKKTSAKRVKELRQRKRALGLSPLEIWAKKEHHAAIRAFVAGIGSGNCKLSSCRMTRTMEDCLPLLAEKWNRRAHPLYAAPHPTMNKLFVDGREYYTDQTALIGGGIKKLAGTSNYHLYLELENGDQRAIDDGEAVRLDERVCHFFVIPPATM